MANVGLIIVGMRAQVSDLAKDLQAAGFIVDKFKSKNSNAVNAVLAPKSGGITDTASKVDQYGTQIKKLLHNAGAGALADIADAIGDIGGAIAALGPAGGVIAGVAVAVGVLATGIVAVQQIASSGMKAVDAAFRIGDKSKTLEALQKIIDAGGSAGITITLGDTQKVQAVNEAFIKVGNQIAALGIQIVSDFQPEILGMLEGMRSVIETMATAARIAKDYTETLSRTANKVAPEGSLRRAVAVGAVNGWLPFLGTAIDSALKTRAAGTETKTSFDKLVDKTVKGPAALEAGSVAQYSASLEARGAMADPVVAEAKEHTNQQKQTNRLLERLLAAVAVQQTIGLPASLVVGIQ